MNPALQRLKRDLAATEAMAVRSLALAAHHSRCSAAVPFGGWRHAHHRIHFLTRHEDAENAVVAARRLRLAVAALEAALEDDTR